MKSWQIEMEKMSSHSHTRGKFSFQWCLFKEEIFGLMMLTFEKTFIYLLYLFLAALVFIAVRDFSGCVVQMSPHWAFPCWRGSSARGLQ